MSDTPDLTAVEDVWAAREGEKSSGSISAAHIVPRLVLSMSRFSTGPTDSNSSSGPSKVVYEGVVDVDVRPLGRISELSPETATEVPACDRIYRIV